MKTPHSFKIIVTSAPDSQGRQSFTMTWVDTPREDKLDPRPMSERGNRAQCFHARVSDYIERFKRDGRRVEVVPFRTA